MLRHVDVAAGGRADHRVHEPDHARQRGRKNPAAGQELKVFQETTNTGQARSQAEASFVLLNRTVKNFVMSHFCRGNLSLSLSPY